MSYRSETIRYGRHCRAQSFLRSRAECQAATPATKTMYRLERKFKAAESRQRRSFYEGFSINIPRAGDRIMHVSMGGVRRSIRIIPSGAMRWSKHRFMTPREIMEAA